MLFCWKANCLFVVPIEEQWHLFDLNWGITFCDWNFDFDS